MTINGIKQNVQALLVASDLFATVLDHPPTEKENFAGYPAAAHYYTDTESSYATVSQNRRVIEYTVELYTVINNSEATESEKFNAADDLVDSVVQLFDVSRDLSSTELNLARACDIMRPAPGSRERINTADGEGLLTTIKLYCEADVTFLNQ